MKRGILLLAFAWLALNPFLAAGTFGDDVCKLVRQMRRSGLILEVRSDGYGIYVSKDWYTLPLKTKEAMAAGMLKCINPRGKHVNIYDGFSGKKVGRYGAAWGFTSYE